jgi:hypothetical protein
MKRTITKIIVVSLVSILLLSLVVGMVIQRKAGQAGAELGLIVLAIDGSGANLTADIEISPDIKSDGTELKLDLGDQGVEVLYDGKRISVLLEENEFRELVGRDTVNISGKVRTPLIGPLNMDVNMDEEVNISFIRELSDTMKVSNVRVNFTFFGNPEILFDFDANISRDFIINITDTEAVLTSSNNQQFKANIIEMNYRTGQGGTARISIPPLGLLGLALFNRNVLVEAWGIEVEVDIPIFSG